MRNMMIWMVTLAGSSLMMRHPHRRPRKTRPQTQKTIHLRKGDAANASLTGR